MSDSSPTVPAAPKKLAPGPIPVTEAGPPAGQTEAPAPYVRKRLPGPMIHLARLAEAQTAADKPKPKPKKIEMESDEELDEFEIPPEGTDSEFIDSLDPDARPDLSKRLRQQKGGKARKIFLRPYLMNCLMTGVQPDQIAKQLNVSIRTIYNWQKELNESLVDEAKNIDPYRLYGQMVATYDEMLAQAWREALDMRNKAADRAKFHDNARGVLDSKKRFLGKTKFFENTDGWHPTMDNSRTEEGARIDAFQEILGKNGSRSWFR
jgi:hypothetical protein